MALWHWSEWGGGIAGCCVHIKWPCLNSVCMHYVAAKWCQRGAVGMGKTVGYCRWNMRCFYEYYDNIHWYHIPLWINLIFLALLYLTFPSLLSILTAPFIFQPFSLPIFPHFLCCPLSFPCAPIRPSCCPTDECGWRRRFASWLIR